MQRPSFLSQTSSNRRPTSVQTRGSSTIAPSTTSPTTGTGAWGTPSPTTEHPTSAGTFRRKSGPSLSLALAPSGDAAAGAAKGELSAKIHPLKYNWDVWFSHRSAGAGTGKGSKKEEAVKAQGKEKESREEWEGGVVRLGGFSSVESLHPFLAHLCPPSALPASVATTAALFTSLDSDSLPPANNVISDINIFRSPIAPLWEDAANAGGGRWVLRLRKGVADRVWEEVVFALVGERIGGDDERSDSAGGKVNGVVLSVRKDEDILSLWCAPSSRTERDIIRDSLRTALEPLLTPSSSANLTLDYKPHPVSHPPTSAPHTASSLSHRADPPHREREHSNTSSSARVGGERASGRTGFSSYGSRTNEGENGREYHTREGTRESSVGYGARTRRTSDAALERVGSALKESRGSAAGSWGRAS